LPVHYDQGTRARGGRTGFEVEAMYSYSRNGYQGDFRSLMSRFKPEVIDADENLLKLIRDLADGKQSTPARNRSRLGARAEAVDRANSRHDKSGASTRKSSGGNPAVEWRAT
jgi:hypothetical protein